MEEIKVGEYIKTVAGYIGKIINFSDGMYTAKMKDATIDLYIDDIKNHKEKIIDLVQAGDIVLYNINCKMTDIEIVKEHIDARTLKKTLRVGLWSLEQVNIKQILTKERFESESYRLEE